MRLCPIFEESSGAAVTVVLSPLLTSTKRIPAMIVPSALAIRIWRPGTRAQGGSIRSSSFCRRRSGLSDFLAFEPVEAVGEQVADGVDLLDEFGDRLATMIEHLRDRADADGEKKRNDQCGDGTTQSRFGDQQPPISGLRNRLR